MISVIIPVYNEEKLICRFLRQFHSAGNLEVIVVDGGSRDRTPELAARLPVRLLHSARKRSLQMNEGAKAACGENLLFLHADCILEPGCLDEINRCLADGFVGGCLLQRLDSSKIVYRLIEASGNIRAKVFRVFYGDQAIFARRDIFFKAGGFGDAEFFEDIEFSRKLKGYGRVAILNKRVHVLPRRWQAQGLVKTTLINWALSAGFLLGLPASALKKMYPDVRLPLEDKTCDTTSIL